MKRKAHSLNHFLRDNDSFSRFEVLSGGWQRKKTVGKVFQIESETDKYDVTSNEMDIFVPKWIANETSVQTFPKKSHNKWTNQREDAKDLAPSEKRRWKANRRFNGQKFEARGFFWSFSFQVSVIPSLDLWPSIEADVSLPLFAPFVEHSIL